MGHTIEDLLSTPNPSIRRKTAYELAVEDDATRVKKLENGYVFNTTKDNIGLPQEHQTYAKKSCKSCRGKGYLLALVGDGYLPPATPGARRMPRMGRQAVFCGCHHKGYTKARLALQAAVEQLMKAKDPSSALTEEEMVAQATAEYIRDHALN